jgi:hypothetical protein
MAHATPVLVVDAPGDRLVDRVDETGWPLVPPTLLTIHRTSLRDEQSRQIVCKLDGVWIADLLYGHTRTCEIAPGRHTLRLHNTLIWKTVIFDAAPGSHMHVTVWNRAWFGYYVMLFFVGAAPLGLGVAPGIPIGMEIAVPALLHQQ